ncbi:MAG: hypothetical protein JXB07_16355 [Anaerolineae bacterium]|nr:hypothetical protein [Anaerolineae bacterium]
MPDKKLPVSQILYEDPSTWVMSLDELDKWAGNLPQHSGDLAIGFCSLKRWLTEHIDDASIRARSLALTHRFLDEVEKWLAHGKPSSDDLCLLFGILMTMIGEAGPYRFETRRDPSGKLDQEIRGPMAEIRFRTVDVSKVLFGRREFDRIRESIDAEIIPILDGAIEAQGGESDRFMPFRIIEAGKVAERLLELAMWLEESGDGQPKDAELVKLLKRFYDLKYPRFGTSGLRGRWNSDFTEEKALRTTQAVCQYMAAVGIPDFVVPGAQPLAGKWVVIGYDGRRNSDLVANWLAGVALQNGFDVYLANLPTPTPALIYQAVERIGKEKIAGILNCTASHNPPEWQGIKFNPKEGYPAPTHLTDIIAARANEMQLLGVDIPRADLAEAEANGRLQRFDPLPSYWEWMKENGKGNQRIPLDLTRIREYFKDRLIIIDEMHGSSRGYMGHILGELGIPHRVIHAERNIDLGELDYANPELPYIKPLMETVKDKEADLGLGMDTDADRFGVVGEGGVYYRPNQVLAMLVHYLCNKRGLEGRVVITQTGLPVIDTIAGLSPGNTSFKPSGQVIPAYVDHPFYKRRVGQREDMVWDNVFVVPVGIKYIVEIPRMDNQYRLRPEDELGTTWMNNLLLGGEESSGLTTRGHVPDKDGVWANLLILDMIAYHGKPLSEIWQEVISLPGCWDSYGGRTDVDASDGAKERLISYYLDKFIGVEPGKADIGGHPVLYAGGTRYDMVEIFLGDEEGKMRNFLRIRASGTEPINRVYTETKDPELWKELQHIVLARLDEFTNDEIAQAYRVENLADILAATHPETWSVVKEAILEKLDNEQWSLEDLRRKLMTKRKHVENRNREVIEHWLEELGN